MIGFLRATGFMLAVVSIHELWVDPAINLGWVFGFAVGLTIYENVEEFIDVWRGRETE